MVIIKRDFENEFKVNKIRLVFGRRKTGKSYYVENYVDWHKYLFVYRDKSIKDIKTLENWNYDELKRYIQENKDKQIVIDEFHRLGENFLDFLHSIRANNLILITSSFHFANNLLEKKSPVLGLTYPIKFTTILPKQILSALKKEEKSIEYSILLLEPSLLDLFNFKESTNELLKKYFDFAKYWVVALFGEIFEEEDRKLTAIYDAIVRAISFGKSSSGEIADYLFSNKLIDKNTPTLITPYLEVLTKIEVLERIELFSTKKIYKYRLVSPAIDFYFYLNSKYGDNISENDLSEAWNYKLPLYIEVFIEKLFANKFNLTPIKYSKSNLELDITLKSLNNIKVICEVKWQDISKTNLENICAKLSEFKQVKKYLFVKSNSKKLKYYKDLNIIDAKSLFSFLNSKDE